MQPRSLPTCRYTSTRCYVGNSYIGKSVHLLLGQTTYLNVQFQGQRISVYQQITATARQWSADTTSKRESVSTIFWFLSWWQERWHCSVGMSLSCGLNDRGLAIRLPGGPRESLFHGAQINPGDHPVFYALGTGGGGGGFPEGKVARAWTWPYVNYRWR